MRRRTARALSFLLLVSFFEAPVWGLTVLQLNLEQLTALSERVFVGRCVLIKESKDAAGRPVADVTFEVEEMVKGEPSNRVTFRQLRPSPEGLLEELPQYKVGEESVVFLSAESRLGLTAPVGLGQGKFQVETTEGGKTLVNGVGNRGLFIGWKKSPRFKAIGLTSSEKDLLKVTEGPLPLEGFLSLVRKLATD